MLLSLLVISVTLPLNAYWVFLVARLLRAAARL